jgi:hypothetical protein
MTSPNPKVIARIVHLSDIHFGHIGVIDLWTSLIDHVRSLDPAAVLISGDIVNTPWRKHFRTAVAQLALLAPAVVRVCPGNHDRHVFGNALGGFRPPFGRDFFYYLSDCYVPAPRADVVSLGPRVKAVITAIDSSDQTSYFARSFVDKDTLAAIRVAFDTTRTMLEPNDLVVRAVLFHHHLLPIATLEATRDRLWGPFSSATTLVVNSGTVLNNLAESEVDFVFHGHEHRRNVGKYAAIGGNGWPVTVIGAGSATGTDTKRGWSIERASFNILDVCDDDSIWVSECVYRNEQWSSIGRQKVMDGVELRQARYERCRTSLPAEDHVLRTHYTYHANGDCGVHRVITAGEIAPDGTFSFNAYSETGTPVEPEVWLEDGAGKRTFGRIEAGFRLIAELRHTYSCTASFPIAFASSRRIVGTRYLWNGAAILRMEEIRAIPEPARPYLYRHGWEHVSSKTPKSPALFRALEISVEVPRAWAPDDVSGNFAVFVEEPGMNRPHEHIDLTKRLYYNGDGLFSLRVEFPDSETKYYICWRPREAAR